MALKFDGKFAILEYIFKVRNDFKWVNFYSNDTHFCYNSQNALFKGSNYLQKD